MKHAFTVCCLAALPILIALGAAAQDNASADRIEEDWELVIASPDPDVTGPQITMTMKPDASDSSPTMLLNLNYRDQPSFSSGGSRSSSGPVTTCSRPPPRGRPC